MKLVSFKKGMNVILSATVSLYLILKTLNEKHKAWEIK